jgi:hypothetical protein
MKYKKIIEELKKFESTDTVEITIDMYKKSLVEICYHSGQMFNKNFTCDTETIWRGAELSNEGMVVSDLIELLEKKELSEMTDSDFNNLSIISSYDGGIEVSNINWESELTDDEKLELNENDLYWDSEITDCKVQFGPDSINSISIKCSTYETQI